MSVDPGTASSGRTGSPEGKRPEPPVARSTSRIACQVLRPYCIFVSDSGKITPNAMQIMTAWMSMATEPTEMVLESTGETIAAVTSPVPAKVVTRA